MASAIISWKRILYVVTVHGYLEENFWENLCGGFRWDFKIKLNFHKFVRVLILQFKNWHFVKFLFQKFTHFIFFNSKSAALNKLFWETCFSKLIFVRIVLFGNAQKRQKLCILRGKFSQNLIFWRHIFVQKKIFKFFHQNKIWHVVKFLIKSLTRCENFVLKSDAL